MKIIGMPDGSTLYIYTVSGELVKTQAAGNGYNGWTEWDGVTDWGKAAATGIYYYVIRSGEDTLARGSLIVRRGGAQ